ncbi:MAG: DUF4430 domain-containing protein [Actinobacteria bacterium]|nr:DUF4430 domain-containing protein [Actinomycetota bacterium]
MPAFRAHGVWISGLLAVALCAAAMAGCGSRPGQTEVAARDGVTLVVTRDFGAKQQRPEIVTEPTKGLTAMRQLESAAKIESSYGGRYVTSIDGVAQDLSEGYDWLFYVDGVESDVGAAAVKPVAGQLVQWDFHRWRDVKTGGAIVGAFPRPLEKDGVALECVPQVSVACTTVRQRLRSSGIRMNTRGLPLRVGTWNELSRLDLDVDLSADPAENGAFAAFPGGREMRLAADDGSAPRALGAGSGLVAAFAEGDSIQWLITGVDTLGVERAAAALDAKQLANRFAVAVDPSGAIALPLTSGEEG